MWIGKFVQNNTGELALIGYDSSTMKDID